MSQDIRWQQRFLNYEKAFVKLSEAIGKIESESLSDNELEKKFTELEKEGVIQRFEYTHELAWNVLKDYFEYQGNADINGSRDATREGFRQGVIQDGEVWMDMIKSRNQTSHTYNEELAKEIFFKIIRNYYPLFILFKDKMSFLISKEKLD